MRKRVLVIDDDPDVREILAEMIASGGHEVVVAANGVEGLEAHRRCPADIAFVDLFMPEKEGFETIQELEREIPRVKIVAMSGGGRSIDAGLYLSTASTLGADAVLLKPFDAVALFGVIEHLLREGTDG